MSWVRALPLAELPVGETRLVELADEYVLVCRVGENELYAVEDVCSHDDGPLGEGELDGSIIECPRHGARFNVATGAVVRLPAASVLATFPVRISDGWIEVCLEDES
jgi:3-phenylpropionate/trans-cinnamate dioxygenase ferredoxin subunit